METFEKEFRGNVAIVTVNLVSATLSDTNEFKGYIEELILITDFDIVVDLSNCHHLDSTFIGALVLSLKKLKQKKRTMVLVEPNDQTKVFLTMNSLSKIFALYKNVEDAVENLLSQNMKGQNHPELIPDNAAGHQSEVEAEVNESVPIETVKIRVNETEIGPETHYISDERNITENLNEYLTDQTSSLEQQNAGSEVLPELVNNLDETVTESELLPEFENGVTDEYKVVERDYREGTIAWEFGI